MEFDITCKSLLNNASIYSYRLRPCFYASLLLRLPVFNLEKNLIFMQLSEFTIIPHIFPSFYNVPFY